MTQLKECQSKLKQKKNSAEKYAGNITCLFVLSINVRRATTHLCEAIMDGSVM